MANRSRERPLVAECGKIAHYAIAPIAEGHGAREQPARAVTPLHQHQLPVRITAKKMRRLPKPPLQISPVELFRMQLMDLLDFEWRS